jgi:hypothetical protein
VAFTGAPAGAQAAQGSVTSSLNGAAAPKAADPRDSLKSLGLI